MFIYGSPEPTPTQKRDGYPRMVRNIGFVAIVSGGMWVFTKPIFVIRGSLFFGYFLLGEQKKVTLFDKFV